MPQWLIALLALLFLAHLLAFTILALRRGGGYYWLLAALFLSLTASFTLRLLFPSWQVGGQAVHVMLRYLAWAMSAVTVPILITRLVKRKRAGP